MPNSFGSALLFKSAGIQSTGLATDGRSILLEHAIPEPPRMHEVERFWYVAYEPLIGLPKHYAILAPIAKGRHEGKEKYWHHFNELCKPLRDRGIEPVVFPAADEAEAAKAACPDATIYEPTSLGNFAALCEKAAIVIANDSGVSHIAAAVGARCRLGGVPDTDRTSPWNEKNVIVGRKGRWPEVDEVITAIDDVLKTKN